MSDQQIDSLTVSVGLTKEEFDTGVKQIMHALGGMRTETATTGESMTGSFAGIGSAVMGLGLEFAALFVAVKGIEDVVGYFKDLSSELANLGFAGRYLGQSAVELSRFGEVAKLAGGSSRDAITAVQSLQQSIFGLEFQGQISQNLLQLQRLGVAYLTTAGQMRPLKDIAMETAAALQRELPGKANEAMRVQWAAQIFGAGGLANAVGGGLAELRKFYAESTKDQKSITQRSIDAQVKTQQDITRLSYDIRSEATTILTRLTPAIQELINVIRNDLIPVIDEIIADILHPVTRFEKDHPVVGHTISAIQQFGRMIEEPFMRGKIEAEEIPQSVMSRIPEDIAASPSALDVLKIFHFEAGGDADDPNWSKAITNYVGFYGDDATRAAADYKEAVAEGRAGIIERPSAAPRTERAEHPGAQPQTQTAARPSQARETPERPSQPRVTAERTSAPAPTQSAARPNVPATATPGRPGTSQTQGAERPSQARAQSAARPPQTRTYVQSPIPVHALSTPAAPRPSSTATTAAPIPVAGTTGPRVQIGQIGPIYTQAKDATRLMADVSRATERKFLVAQADPGLA